MSATPIPSSIPFYLMRVVPRMRRSGQQCTAGPGSVSFNRVPALRSSPTALLRVRDAYYSALDIGRPGLLDQLDHRVRHRNVVEFLGHLAALLERPFEELDRLLGCRLVGRILVHQDEGRGDDRPGFFTRLIGQD